MVSNTHTSTSAPMFHLAIRHAHDNANHHLWNNNGTYWCHFTLKSETGAVQRVRRSLKTRNLEKAKRSRDKLLAAASQVSGRIAA